MEKIIEAKKIIREVEITEDNNMQDIWIQLDLLKNQAAEIYKFFINTIHSKIDSGDFDISEYVNTTNKLKKVNILLDNSFSMTSVAKEEKLDERKSKNKKVKEKKQEQIDFKVSGYPLTSSFTKSKPMAYKLLKEEPVTVKSWKDLYLKTCKELYEIDDKIFKSFIEDSSMNGNVTENFTYNKPNVACYVEIEGNIYINTLFGANEYTDMIMKMLTKYNIDIAKYKIFLR